MKTSNNIIGPLLKPSKPVRTSRSVALAALALALLCSTMPSSAATFVLTPTAPVPGPDDVYNFAGADNDAVNINGGADQQNYVAFDRPTQGQTFTTPAGSATGYLISDIWIRHCGYTNTAPGNGTFWNLGNGAVYTIRVTDPSKTNQAGFAVSTETYTATGTENGGAQWTGGGGLGDDLWLHFTLATPIQLAAATKYGVDLTASVQGGGNYFEWFGSSAATFAGGEAYTGSAAHTPGITVTTNAGDRVFLVQLGHTVPAVTPALTSPLRFVPVGQTVHVTATIPSIANADRLATLVLTNNNPGLISLPGGASKLTLNFAAGATNVQTFDVQVLANGVGSLSVVTNSAFTDASLPIGTPVAAQESFQYDPSVQTVLDQANGGSGFSAPWSQSTLADTIVSGLTFGTNPSLVTSSNAASVLLAGNEAFRTLAGTYGGVGGGTVYVGFLVQAPSGLLDWGGLSLFNGTSTESLFMGEVVASSPNNTWGFLQAGINRMNFAGSVTPGPQTDFLVCRIDFPTTSGGTALVSFYANPPLNTIEPFTPTGSASVNNFTFDRIRLGTSDALVFDEIRIGTQWTNVMQFVGTPQPLPPPTPALSVPARFVPVSQPAVVTVSIPSTSPRPVIMSIINDNPTAFSLSSTNAAATTLTFGVGGTNVQTLNVLGLAAGAATLTVVSNSTVNTATITFASQVSASESFQYATGTDLLPGSAGGIGFDVNTWAGGGSVVSPGLTYPGLVTSSNYANIVGAAAGGTGNGTRALFLSSGDYGGVGGGTVWIGFLIQGAFPVTPQVAGVTLGGIFMGLDTTTANNGKWGFTGPGMGPTGFPNSVTPSTNTDLLVYRLDFPSVAGELVTVTLYANPAVGPTPPATPVGSASANLFTFNSVTLGTDFNMNFDEIRIGGTWAEVVPLATVPSLSVQRISATQVQISWPASVTGYELQSSTSVTGGWGLAGLSETTQGDQRVVTDTITGNAKFYRLHQQ